MFGKKYIFETRKTRTLRYLKNLFIVSVTLIFVYLGAGVVFLVVSQNENQLALHSFYKRPPDLIVVFTGDKGRIPYAISKAKEYNQSKVFITGVYSKNSVDTLLNPLKLNESIDTKMLEIDYLARNTIENVISTLRYLRGNKGHKRILVISHDYHLVRIKWILNNLRTIEDRDYEFYFSGVKSKYDNWRNIKILYTEVYKFLKAGLFLITWDSDMDIGSRSEEI